MFDLHAYVQYALNDRFIYLCSESFIVNGMANIKRLYVCTVQRCGMMVVTGDR